MIQSGRVQMCADDTDLDIISGAGGKESTLSTSELDMLKSTYRQRIPRYGYLLTAYGKDLKRASVTRTKSQIPPIIEWSHPSITPADKALLAGPEPTIFVHKQVLIKDSATRRSVLYTASETVQSSQHKCSYVQSELKVARIQRLFTHTFVGDTRKFAILKIFSRVHQDTDSGIHYIMSSDSDQLGVSLVERLSQPLVFAGEQSLVFEHTSQGH